MKIFKIGGVLLLAIIIMFSNNVLAVTNTINETNTTNTTETKEETYTYENIIYKIVDNEIVVVDCTKDAVTVNIPKEINGLKVTKIADHALSYSTEKLTNVTIPDTVTEIGADVLFAQQIKTLTVPDSVTKIGSDFCNSCEELESVKLPKNLTQINFQSFAGCKKLKSIEIPSKVTTMIYWAFYDCDSLTEVTIPASVTSIDEGIFADCDNLKKVTFLGKEGQIDTGAFTSNSEDLVFCVYKNSTAQAWAVDQNYKYSFIKTPTKLESSNSDISLFLSAEETAELKIDELNKDSETYKELLGKLSNATVYYGYDISVINGEYEGPITITFNFNKETADYVEGKEVIVLHRKSNGEIEQFKQVVKDNKIEIQTDELSPFIVATGTLKEDSNKPQENNNTTPVREKDDTPKTGTVDVISYIIPVAILSGIGIIAFRRKETK